MHLLQVLNFEQYKKRGPIYLDKVSTERLLEQLEDAQALLAQMLTSRYVGPLREEAASWAEKLKEVGEVLESWLEVQDLWQYLEAVFSNPDAAKVLNTNTVNPHSAGIDFRRQNLMSVDVRF